MITGPGLAWFGLVCLVLILFVIVGKSLIKGAFIHGGAILKIFTLGEAFIRGGAGDIAGDIALDGHNWPLSALRESKTSSHSFHFKYVRRVALQQCWFSRGLPQYTLKNKHTISKIK